VLACAALAALTAGAGELPPSALAVMRGGAWRTWWEAGEAPAAWRAPHRDVAGAVRWHGVRPGLERGELRLSGSGEAWRLRVHLLRVDARRFRWSLPRATRDEGMLPAWAVDSAPTAALAVNTGQFEGARPWGWVVRGGREEQAPGTGSLAMALVVTRDGAMRLVGADSIAAVRASGTVAEAFQSYPALLTGAGDVPAPLREEGRGVSVSHRDARLAVCELRDGRIVFALTRFDALGAAMERLPFGPTAPEMAALMGALGCRRAMLLDGGISGQMAVRSAGGGRHTWEGMRRVPLGLVAEAR
jgi:hypothetical protein